MANITWEVTWNASAGAIMFYAGNTGKFSYFEMRIRRKNTVNTYAPVLGVYDENARMSLGQDINVSQLDSELRPLNFTISFNVLYY